jgi:hypothetical protein
VSPAALLIAVLADEAHGVGWLEAKTARVALTDRRKFVHFPMGQQLFCRVLWTDGAATFTEVSHTRVSDGASSVCPQNSVHTTRLFAFSHRPASSPSRENNEHARAPKQLNAIACLRDRHAIPSNVSDEAVGAGLENDGHPVRHRDLAN